MSLWGIGAFIGSYFGGKFTDKIGFYKIQLFSLFFGGIGFIILGQLQNYYAICVATFLLAMVNEAFRPANSAAMGKFSTDENRMRSFTLMRLSFNLGWAVGAGIGGFVAHHSYQLLFWVDGVTNILAAILLWYLLPDKYTTSSLAKKENATQKISVLSDKVFVQFILISVIFLSCFVQLFTNLPVYFKKELHFEENYIGYLSSWNGLLIVMIEMTLICWREKNWTKRRAVTIGVAFHVLAYLLMVFYKMPYYVAFIMMTLITISEMLAMVWAFSQTVGPFLGSVIAQYAGFKVLWLIVALLSLLATFLYAKIIKD